MEEGDPEAGLKLLREIRRRDEYVPLILDSSETINRAKAEAEGFHFIDKNSTKLNVDLHHLIEEHMGFGDFIFRDPVTKQEVFRVTNLKELQDNIFKIPRESMLYHVSRNHMSRWLCARAIFPVSALLKHVTWHKLKDVDAHRQIIFEAIVQYRRMKNIGVVAVFDRMKFDAYSHFARIGEGSLGGKGRGLAFLDNIIKRHPELNQYEHAQVTIPKTVVLCTDFFDEFMEKNNLYPIALSDAPDEEILKHFMRAQLPDSLIADFFTFFDAVKSPIAVRSSSLLEDSHYQPFAGIYSTYMIPYLDDKYEMLRMLACAIKGVYASVNYKGLCPFHDDKTPSFMVSPARQICKCFSCGEGGNAVNFLMKHEQITYPEALRWLAKKYNIEIQERELTDDEKREQSDRESMFVVNEWACQYFHEILKNDVDGIAIGKQYFRSRGIREDIIEKFQLGFALSKRDALANEARRKVFKDEFLIKTGLCYQPSPNPQHPSPDNLLIDRFAGR